MRLPQLNNVGWGEGNRAEPFDIWNARKFIPEHSDDELSLTQVAKAVDLSGNPLSEKCQQVTGVNFGEYIARARFEKARGLLHDPDLRGSEIAFAAECQSLSEFNRVFKKMTRLSPIEHPANRPD